MQRRNFILGLGATATGAAGVVGSGAFSSVEADREITVDVERDAEAFLTLVPNGGGNRSDVSDDLLKFRLPSLQETGAGNHGNEPNPQNPQGLGADSVYRFGKDAAADAEPPLFQAKNRGTQPVRVFGTPEEAGDKPTVRIFEVENGDLLTEESPSEEVEVGHDIGLGLEVDTHGLETDFYETVVTITALANDELSE